MATEAARLERKESTGRRKEKREKRKEKREKRKEKKEKHTWLIPAFSWKALAKKFVVRMTDIG
jgi:hypothetical protein